MKVSQKEFSMNDVINAILERRSIRKYKPDAISEEDRNSILKAGLYAPSSKNAQAWHITAIENAEVTARITSAVKAAIQRAGVEKYLAFTGSPKYSVNFGNAPLFVIVSADPEVSSCAVEDCSVLLENMFLAAHSLGIGSCWINQLGCITDEPEFRQFITGLGIPEKNRIYGSACFGYNAGSHPVASPRKAGTINIIK